MSYNLDHIESLIVRSLDHTLEPEEQQQLQAWLEEDADHRRYYTTLQQTWQLTGEHDPATVEPDTDRNWAEFRQKLETPAAMQVVRGNNNRTLLRVAAAVLVLIGGTILYFVLQNQREIKLFTAAGEKKSIVLPDGSRVFMNQHSSLRYANNLAGAERAVYLEGEAYFEVAKQPARPFVVYAHGTQTQVLGTAFDVNAYDATSVEISVLSGKVAVSRKTATRDLHAGQLVLTPGRKAIFKGDAPLEEHAIRDFNFIAWKENRLVFNSVPLKDVFSALENYYGIQIKTTDSSITHFSLKAVFDHTPQKEMVLNVIAESVGLLWREENGVYIFSWKYGARPEEPKGR